MSTQEYTTKTIETAKSTMSKAPDLGKQAIKAADKGLHTIIGALPQTEQQRKAEQRGNILRWGSIATGAIAVASAGIKFGPDLVRTYGPGIKQQASELVKQIPFGKSHAERQAAIHDTTFNGSHTTDSYPADAPSTTPVRTDADRAVELGAGSTVPGSAIIDTLEPATPSARGLGTPTTTSER